MGLARALGAAFIVYSCTASASPFSEQIESYCEQGRRAPQLSQLSRLIEDTEDRYADQDARVRDPRGFVAALDAILEKSEFSGILRCRDQAGRGFHYGIEFQNPAAGDQSMELQVDDRLRLLRLEFNLTKSVARVLFIYLHELVHVCQTNERESGLATGDSIRFGIFGEVQAFYVSQLAYRRLLPLSPRLCRAGGRSSDSPERPLFQVYLNGERELEQGNFAQSVLNNYLVSLYRQFYEGYGVDAEAELLDLSSPLHTYVDAGTKSLFQIHSLRPELKNRIERLGIRVTEP